MPFPVLQKLVGHSRLLMTLYYTKPGGKHIRDVLLGAAARTWRESTGEESRARIYPGNGGSEVGQVRQIAPWVCARRIGEAPRQPSRRACFTGAETGGNFTVAKIMHREEEP